MLGSWLGLGLRLESGLGLGFGGVLGLQSVLGSRLVFVLDYSRFIIQKINSSLPSLLSSSYLLPLPSLSFFSSRLSLSNLLPLSSFLHHIHIIFKLFQNYFLKFTSFSHHFHIISTPFLHHFLLLLQDRSTR